MWMQHASRSSMVVVDLPPLEQVCVCHGEASERVDKHPTFNKTDSNNGPPGNLKYLSDSPPPLRLEKVLEPQTANIQYMYREYVWGGRSCTYCTDLCRCSKHIQYD